MNTTLLNLLESIFGKSKLFRGDESYHRCPFCHHHKKKLAINLSNYAWHCWVCDAKGKTLYSLFKKNNCSKEQIDELNSITGKKVYKKKRRIIPSIDFLKPEGRLAVITFHSIEDRLIKNIFKDFSNGRESIVREMGFNFI